MMKTILLALAVLVATQPLASAWAILLDKPSFVYPVQGKQADIRVLEAEMAKLQFDGGVIHVSVPNPARNLRFNSPGQEISTILPHLHKVGFEVNVAFSKSSARGHGFMISQNEHEPKKLAIVINTSFEGFDLEKLKLTVPAEKQRKRNQRID